MGQLIIRLDGSPNYASASAAVPSIVNVVLDYVFLFVLDMGLEGVAFATAITLSVVNVATIGYFQSVERALPATLFSLCRGVIFLVPCFLVIPRFAGVDGIWLALPTTEALTFLVIASFHVFSGARKPQNAMSATLQ